MATTATQVWTALNKALPTPPGLWPLRQAFVHWWSDTEDGGFLFGCPGMCCHITRTAGRCSFGWDRGVSQRVYTMLTTAENLLTPLLAAAQHTKLPET